MNSPNYYPYGKTLRKYTNGPEEKFLTTQHERDAETGLDYRGARFYDADVARFLSLDPLASSFPSWCSYNYVLSNPLRFIDPKGLAPTDEFTFNAETGEMKKVSDLGGDQVDFVHIHGGKYDGKTMLISAAYNVENYDLRNTNVPQGIFQMMSSSEFIEGYQKRAQDVDWNDIANEFLSGFGPEKSLIYGAESALIKGLMSSDLFASTLKKFADKIGLLSNTKFPTEYKFGINEVVKAGNNMTAQMIGSASVSFYTFSSYVVVVVMDSKSVSSWTLSPFDADEANIPRDPNSKSNQPQTTTYQTYVVIMTKKEAKKFLEKL